MNPVENAGYDKNASNSSFNAILFIFYYYWSLFFCPRAINLAIEAHQILISRKNFRKRVGTTIMYDISKIPKIDIS